MRTLHSRYRSLIGHLMSCAALGALAGGPMFTLGIARAAESPTATPIKHVIIIIGENRTFDHVFATYQPVNKDTVLNLLSQQIIKSDGTPGTNYAKAQQDHAQAGLIYELSPGQRTPYVALPPALTGGPSTPYGCQVLGITTGTSCVSNANIVAIKAFENGLDDGYYQFMLSGGTGQGGGVPDTRILYDGKDASHLPPGPYQLTNPTKYPYDAYAASPVHRFYQMRQQLDCDASLASPGKGWGCRHKLFLWVEVTVGAGSNGAAQPPGFNDESTGEGSTSMGLFNVQQGDVPYLKKLADTYTMSDNYHQAVNGGTGANHIMLGTGDAIWFSDGMGNPAIPPNFGVNPSNPGTPFPGQTSALTEIENPNPQPGTNNFYTQDGYGGGSGSPTAMPPKANYGGGSYTNCSDLSQPGVAPSSATCRRSRVKSTRIARAVTITCSTTTIPGISATAATLILTQIRTTTSLRFRPRACVTSEMRSMINKSPGPTMEISETSTLMTHTNCSSTAGRTNTATFAIGRNIPHRS